MNNKPDTFMKFFGSYPDDAFVEGFRLENRDMLLVGTESLDGELPSGIFLSCPDEYGELYRFEIALRGIADGIAASDMKVNGDQILVMGHVINGNSSDLLLWTLNTQGEPLDTLVFGNPNQNERNGHFVINEDGSYTVAAELWAGDQLIGNSVATLNPTASDASQLWDVKFEDLSNPKEVIDLKRLSSGQVVWVGSNNSVDEGNSDVIINLIDRGFDTKINSFGTSNNVLDRIYGLHEVGNRLVVTGATNESGMMQGRVISFNLSNQEIEFNDTITAEKELPYELIGYDELDNGNLLVCGFQYTATDDRDPYLAEWTESGEIVWERIFDNPYGANDIAYRVEQIGNNILLYGQTSTVTNEAMLLVRTRLDGSL